VQVIGTWVYAPSRIFRHFPEKLETGAAGKYALLPCNGPRGY
jgi:hypothetical protein